MRPLIPRIRPGDVLKGTRNLRNWLQTASVLNYLSHIRHDYAGVSKARERLYTPSKNDEFLVTVNAWGTFGACSVNKDVVLLFHNQLPTSFDADLDLVKSVSPKYTVVATSHATKGARDRKKKKSAVWPSMHAPRMNPTIFSQWFIRTDKKYLDVGTWPQYAVFMWASLHLNMCSIPTGEARVLFHPVEGAGGPFQMHTNGNEWEVPALMEFLQKWYPRGITRPRKQSPRDLGTVGPHVREISGMKREIRKLCSNPRVLEKLKKDKGEDWHAFSQTYLMED